MPGSGFSIKGKPNTGVKKICDGYVSLFAMWPLKFEVNKAPMRVVCARSLAGYWERVGSHMKNAFEKWEHQESSPK
jgi:hypothetical protein